MVEDDQEPIPRFQEGDHIYYNWAAVTHGRVVEPEYMGRVYKILPPQKNAWGHMRFELLTVLGPAPKGKRKGRWSHLIGSGDIVFKGPPVYPLVLLPRKTGMAWTEDL